jgi:hypothetical protein
VDEVRCRYRTLAEVSHFERVSGRAARVSLILGAWLFLNPAFIRGGLRGLISITGMSAVL